MRHFVENWPGRHSNTWRHTTLLSRNGFGSRQTALVILTPHRALFCSNEEACQLAVYRDPRSEQEGPLGGLACGVLRVFVQLPKASAAFTFMTISRSDYAHFEMGEGTSNSTSL